MNNKSKKKKIGATFSRAIRRWLVTNHVSQTPQSNLLQALQGVDPNTERLDLKNMGLQLLPPELFELESLTWLQFSQNHIETIPPAIMNFKELKMMRLFSNNLRAFPPEIGELMQLNTLDVGKNLLTSLCPEIGKCSSLTELNLQWNQITELPDTIGNLQQLRILNLYINQLQSLPDSLSQLHLLEVLDLAHNQIKSVSYVICSLPSLTSLNMVGNGFTHLPDDFGNLQKLRRLDLRCNYLEYLPEGICTLPLRQLFVRNNYLSELPGNFGNLRELIDCRLEMNRLTHLPESIGECQNLKILMVDENQLTSVHPALGKVFGLNELALSSNLLSSLPDELGQLKSLETLVLAKNLFEELPVCLGQLSSLTDLELGENRLNQLPSSILETLPKLGKLNVNKNLLHSIPPEISRLRSLVFLELAYNQIQVLPEEIQQLQALTFLNVAHNHLKDLPKCISSMTELQKLYISYNPLSEFEFPAEFSNLQKLEEFVAVGIGLQLIPACLYRIPIKYLDLSGNRIRELGTEFPQWDRSLTSLIISGNEISVLPCQLGKLIHLTDFDCSLNAIGSIPEEFSNMVSLVDVDFSGNQISSMPMDLRDLANLLQMKLAHNQLAQFPKLAEGTSAWLSIEGNPGTNKRIRKRDLGKYNEYEACFPFLAKPGRSRYVDTPVASDQVSKFKFGWTELRGRRPDQQDTIAIVHNFLGFNDYHFCGLYDGHGGTISAEIVAMCMHQIIAERYLARLSQKLEIHMEDLFTDSFRFVQMELTKHAVNDGTAANIVFLTPQCIHVANAGDSRTILIREENEQLIPIPLSKDHKPENSDERARIEAQGGFVTESKRVNGVLALSRALGDCDLQPPITCDPVLTTTQITPQDRWIVMGCDGLWDIVSNEQVADLLKNAQTAKDAAICLRDCAFTLGSTDNISVIVIAVEHT
jgi:adenylate cyclase